MRMDVLGFCVCKCVCDKHMQRSPHANSRQEREKTHAKKPTCKVKTKLMAKVKELCVFCD
ncbi:hypothetical protein DVH24_022719 [Malus domestica]|uniref:Uncharacterized protein n=1 Tax=Malus domestica TaxID=3750 RepID=A0A498KSB1_MALDO|nr:hypothetical protein DVH24_022719 [Malus domestica]